MQHPSRVSSIPVDMQFQHMLCLGSNLEEFYDHILV
jgi:hypothetical protein